MVKRPLKLPEKVVADDEAEPVDAGLPEAEVTVETRKPEAEPTRSQRRRPEVGRYWLQVDRQTKSSYNSEAEAEAAGMAIKTKFAQVQVAIYDRDKLLNRVLEVPAV